MSAKSVKDYDLFIFDWDGTLSTSTFLIRLSNLLKIRYFRKHIMKHKDEYMRSAEKNIKVEENTNKIYSYLYDLYSSVVSPRLKSGVIEMLGALKKKRKKIAIFSDSQTYRLMLEVRKLGILDDVDFVLSASSVGRYKPDPTGLMLIADRYKVPKNRILYVGDMASDIITAKFAGISSCGVCDGLASYSSLKEAEPDYIFSTIQSLLTEIEN